MENNTRTISLQEAKRMYGPDIKPGRYELDYELLGGLVVGGFSSQGVPQPGKQELIFSQTIKLFIVEDEYLNHGQGD